MQAVILAGGKGSRLKPFTVTLPKPLMPIDDMPILKIVLKQLKHHGITDIVIAVNHLSELIMAFIGDGKKMGLNIRYSIEDTMLGTAGPLSIIDHLDDNFIVMNGDILTTLNYQKLMNYHLENKNDATVSIYKKELTIDLGVLEVSGDTLTNYIEKPAYPFWVSMGIYAFNKSVLQFIKKGEKLDLPDLIMRLKNSDLKLKCYHSDYFWLDIGRVADYEEAVRMFQERRSEFLSE